jgi:hypothetical protein
MDKERLIGIDESGYSEVNKDKAMEDQFNNGGLNKQGGNIFISKKDKKKEDK